MKMNDWIRQQAGYENATEAPQKPKLKPKGIDLPESANKAVNAAIRSALGWTEAEAVEPEATEEPAKPRTPKGHAGTGAGAPPPQPVNPTEQFNDWLRSASRKRSWEEFTS